MRSKTSHTSRLFGTTALLAGSVAVGLAGIAMLSTDASATPLLKRFYESREPGARFAKSNPLRVGLYHVGDSKVEVVLTNTSRKTLRIPHWQLPDAAQVSNVFQVNLDGQAIRYDGAMVKRGVPTAEDFAIIRPGRTHRTVVDLSTIYDMTVDGHYTVAYNAPLQFASLSGSERLKQANGAPMMAKSVPIQMRAAAPASPAGGRPRPPGYRSIRSNPNTAFGLNVTYVGCTAERQELLGNAVVGARQYSENSRGYLNSSATGPRYTSWFGAYTASRYGTVQQHFVDIDNAMDINDGRLTLNCNCTAVSNPASTYAYVFPSQHYQIYLCGAFWNAPMFGTDSKAGTVIHEMSHFNVVAGTDDHAYGQSAAGNLANTNPTLAVDNADNHEYFAENTPFQN
jgi:peptidyl-Lys metalloendopeptidase